MEDLSNLDLLSAYAEKTGRICTSVEKPVTLGAVSKVTYHYRHFYMADNKVSDAWLVGYSNPVGFSEFNLFWGVFLPLPFPVAAQAEISSKDIFDTLNPFRKKNDYESSIYSFDSKVIIRGKDFGGWEKLLNNTQIQNILLEILEKDQSMRIGINKPLCDFVPALANTSYLSIYTTTRWIMDFEYVEYLFGEMGKVEKKFL